MALPFTTVKLDKERKFRFTLGDMVELQEWASARSDGKLKDMESIFSEMGTDFAILLKILWLGLRHFEENNDLKEEELAQSMHMGAVPGIILKASSFITSEDGTGQPLPNLPRPAKTTVKKRAGTGAKSSKQPAPSA